MIPTLALAFSAGILSFLSPCVLPLVPSYLAYVGGNARQTKKNQLIVSSLWFILGFSLVFVALGASASLVGAILRDQRSWLIVVGGLVIIFFGLLMLGVVNLPFLYRDTRQGLAHQNASTPWGGVLLGMAFAAGWTPCIGPVLGSILTLAGTSETLGQGVGLLLSYALGLALPFFVAAVSLDSFIRFSQGFRQYLPWVERIAGGLLIIAGLLMVTGSYTSMNSFLIRLTPDWLISRL